MILLSSFFTFAFLMVGERCAEIDSTNKLMLGSKNQKKSSKSAEEHKSHFYLLSLESNFFKTLNKLNLFWFSLFFHPSHIFLFNKIIIQQKKNIMSSSWLFINFIVNQILQHIVVWIPNMKTEHIVWNHH